MSSEEHTLQNRTSFLSGVGKNHTMADAESMIVDQQHYLKDQQSNGTVHIDDIIKALDNDISGQSTSVYGEISDTDEESALQEMARDLEHVDLNSILPILGRKGWESTARILGYDISQYQNLILSGRMAIWDIKRKMPSTVLEYIEILKHRFDEPVLNFLTGNAEELQEMVNGKSHTDLNFDWFSAQSLIRTYLSRPSAKESICETPRHMWMRIAVAHYHNEGMERVEIMFNDLCDQYFITASPTIFNAGFKKGQMASCFLITIADNLESILYTGVGDQGIISKNNGGIGLDLSRLRHSEIGSFGESNGLGNWLHLYNAVARAVDQGSRRKGACSVYCRTHHIDIYEFCEKPLKTGDHYERAHDLNFAIWFPRLFWRRLEKDEDWTLFCPNKTVKLNELWGFEWEKQYEEYEQDLSVPRKLVKARHLMEHITSIQRRTGMPYIMHADACNGKSNQKHLGYIRQGNLCLEIIQFTNDEEIAVCNLSSLSLRAFCSGSKTGNLIEDVDFDQMGIITRRSIENLNQLVDKNFYPLEKCRKSNMRHRPVGLGVSGFAEMLHELDLPFHDPEHPTQPHPQTKQLNKMIFACMYWNSLAQSVIMSARDGPFETFVGSPTSEGKLQFDLWADEFKELKKHDRLDSRFRKPEDDIPTDPFEWHQKAVELPNGDVIQPTWKDLKQCIHEYGLRNSLLIALMPTASYAQPLRNTESVEAPQSCIYSRKVMNGAYPVVNRYMVEDLQKLGLWNRSTVDLIQADQGSISKLTDYVKTNLSSFSGFNNSMESWKRLGWIQHKYKTMWELSMKIFLQLAADRGRYVDQSQSTNVYLSDPTDDQLIAIHLHTHHLGLKTGMYYLRTSAAVDPIKFTVDPDIIKFVKGVEVEHLAEEEEVSSDSSPDSSSGESSPSIRSSGSLPNGIGKNGKKIVCDGVVCINCD